jgi:hypothetical protein
MDEAWGNEESGRKPAATAGIDGAGPVALVTTARATAELGVLETVGTRPLLVLAAGTGSHLRRTIPREATRITRSPA